MEAQSSEIGLATVLALSGRFDVHQAPSVTQWLEVATASTPARVVVDLARVAFVDSTALAALVRGMKRARQQGGDVHLAALQSPVKVIFELTRMDRAFRIYDTADDAAAAFAG